MAAGGVITRGAHILVLYWPSRDEVRLPKGHVEPGETVQEAALREVAEETGYVNLRIVADLGVQQVAFEGPERRVVRSERYFLMVPHDDPEGLRRCGEDKFDLQWLPWDEALDALTFEAEREWVRRARHVIRMREGRERNGGDF